MIDDACGAAHLDRLKHRGVRLFLQLMLRLLDRCQLRIILVASLASCVSQMRSYSDRLVVIIDAARGNSLHPRLLFLLLFCQFLHVHLDSTLH